MELKDLKLTKRRQTILESLDIKDIDALLRYYPSRYEENITKGFKDWQVGDVLIFEGQLISYPSTYRYGKRSLSRFKVLYDDEVINVTIFNRPWANSLSENQMIVLKGKYEGKNNFVASNYSSHSIEEEMGIKAIYPIKEGIKQSDIVAMLKKALAIYDLVDYLPSYFKEKHQLIDLQSAYEQVHFPSDKTSLKQAITRLKYDEFLVFYSSLNSLKRAEYLNKKAKNFAMEKIESFIAKLDFTLTNDQKSSLTAILDDLRKTKVMTRLLQGDVGSGKTIVATIALYANSLSGYQGAFLAPTSILAYQHFESLNKLLPDLRIALLCGGSNEEVKQALKINEIDIVVGTHALFSDDVEYANLGLVVADEQQRFGVKQRRKLRDKGQNVDLLLMSATPIPRTLASVIYGDMDVSLIASMPSERKGCDTYLIKANSVVSIMDDIKKTLQANQQVYIIAAAINKSESIKAKDAISLYESLKPALVPYSVGLLHGKMDQKTKDEVMEAFLHNDINVLVSTTVVEVGVNVKNASMMIIYDSDRFGLSQLHQLRGRVQRGDLKGRCYLLTASKEQEVLKRLDVLCKSNDGFYIAEEDLKMRGPGDMIGTRQSGLPPFILGDLMNDKKIIEAAKKDVEYLFEHLDESDFKKYYQKIEQQLSLNAQD